MTVSLEIHGRNGNTGEPSGLFRSIEKVVLWGGSDVVKGKESPDETEIMKNFRIFYQLTNTINKIVYNFVEF